MLQSQQGRLYLCFQVSNCVERFSIIRKMLDSIQSTIVVWRPNDSTFILKLATVDCSSFPQSLEPAVIWP
ncbi:hypothetical protein L596_010852 [Steinernema carpocapsae]|uniref:Uncharacterized protein n=1 Tax=Steinernema carpocapsae TaxID=34508 RepID=A0A4U5PJK4_STECR|nr:hypothetical protein L596_010852 [Steinernema carpocapsae]